MPLSNLLKSTAGTCPFCNQKPGILTRQHPECRRTYQGRGENLLKSTAGTCPFCNQKPGILTRQHPECRRTYQAGWNEMKTRRRPLHG